MRSAEEVLPVYIFDDRVFKAKTRRYGFAKTDRFRTKYIIESIQDLQVGLKQLGSRLIIRHGIAEDIIFQMAHEYKTSWIFCNRERTDEEVKVQDELERKLWSIGQEVRYSRGKMLYYTADLPFPVTHTPDSFSVFKKEVERFVPIREPLDTPTNQFNPLTIEVDYGILPSLENFGYKDSVYHSVKGGETQALERLRYYIWENNFNNSNYKQSRNGLLNTESSTHLSAALSQGCLSPKMVYQELRRYEQKYGVDVNTSCLFHELILRDFLRLMAKKHGNSVFQFKGIQGSKELNQSEDIKWFNVWAEGRTGIPFIDANMKELNETGMISHRGRMNCAYFLVWELKINWLMGAEYFESKLIDYDPCSNYGNWNLIAGVGSDERETPQFNVISQSKSYDAHGEYIKNWLPNLKDLPCQFIHYPDLMNEEERKENNFVFGKTYPSPCVNLIKSC